jgi:bacterioferritin (cytochrome b1)
MLVVVVLVVRILAEEMEQVDWVEGELEELHRLGQEQQVQMD